MMFRHWLRPRTPSARRPFRPRVEQLEDILTPATFTVTTLSDAVGHAGVSLRDAVASANATDEADTITFDASLNGGTITLTQGELAVTREVTITGPGANLLTVSGDSDGDNVGNSRVFNVNDGSASEVAVTISGLTITRGNAGSGFGGGVLNSENLTLDRVAVTNGTAFSGGGVTNNGATLKIERSLIAGNTAASFYGGGVYHHSPSGHARGSVTVTNSTVTANRAQKGGGGLDVSSASAATVTGSTIAGNTSLDSQSGSGLALGTVITARLTDTLIADNTKGTASTPSDLRAVGPLTFTANNILVEANDFSPVQNGVNGNIVGSDPMLAALADNGGPTMTMALLAGSPALNAGGADASADQRGLAVEGTRDIGAYEAHAPARKSALPPAPYKAKKNTVLKVPTTKGVLKRFTDPDGDALTAVLVTPPSKGTLRLKSDGSFIFRPKPNMTGKVTFVVMARDDKGLESPTLKFTINIT